MGKITAAITGVGQYLPEYILTNDELSRMVDTNDEWIMSHEPSVCVSWNDPQ